MTVYARICLNCGEERTTPDLGELTTADLEALVAGPRCCRPTPGTIPEPPF
jgi:hypothetical protein